MGDPIQLKKIWRPPYFQGRLRSLNALIELM